MAHFLKLPVLQINVLSIIKVESRVVLSPTITTAIPEKEQIRKFSSHLLLRWTITQRMADQEGPDFDVNFTMMLCTRNVCDRRVMKLIFS